MINIVQHEVFGRKYGYGKLLLKTTSTASGFMIPTSVMNKDTNWTVLDSLGEVVTSGTSIIGSGNIYIDLSSNTEEVSIYLDVDDTGNGIYSQFYWFGGTDITYYDLAVLPLTIILRLRNSNTLVKNDYGNLLKSSFFYIMNFINIDFINSNTTYERFKIYGNAYNDFTLNLAW